MYIRRNKLKPLSKEDVERILKSNKEELKKYKVKRIGLFGSFAKGEHKISSDIDFIVEFDLEQFDENFKGLYEAFTGLIDYLEGLFRRKIDILTPASMEGIRIKEIKDEIKGSVIYV